MNRAIVLLTLVLCPLAEPIGDSRAIAAEPKAQDCATSLPCMLQGECIRAESGCRKPIDLAEFRTSLEAMARLSASWHAILTSPEVALYTSTQLRKAGRASEAADLLQAALDQFPHTPASKKLRSTLREIQDTLSATPASPSDSTDITTALQAQSVAQFSTNQVIISMKTTLEFLPEWQSDRYGDTYHFQDAKRGKVYAVVKELQVSALTPTPNPALPQLGVYQLKANRLVLLDRLAWALYEWQSHATYLGLEPDYGNDFAYSSDISFTAAVQIPESALEHTLVLIADTTSCTTRTTRSAPPKVHYRPTSCQALPRSLDPSALPARIKVLAVAK